MTYSCVTLGSLTWFGETWCSGTVVLSVFRSVGLSAGRSVCRSVGLYVGLSVCRFVGRSVGRSAVRSVGSRGFMA